MRMTDDFSMVLPAFLNEIFSGQTLATKSYYQGTKRCIDVPLPGFAANDIRVELSESEGVLDIYRNNPANRNSQQPNKEDWIAAVNIGSARSEPSVTMRNGVLQIRVDETPNTRRVAVGN